MIQSFIKKLNGNELKILMTIMLQCDEKLEYGNMEKLIEIDLSYPTIVKCTDSLEKKRCIKKMDTGGQCILRLSAEFKYLVDHFKTIPNQLILIPDEPRKVSAKKWWDKKHQDVLMRHYAIEQGVPIEKLTSWYITNYRANIRGAQFLMDYCGNLKDCLQTITNCKIERSKDKLSWSLGGDIARNIQKYAPRNSSTGEPKKWH